ncbi:hypothetical protein ACO0RG_002868 [Hanseniaspora osmophila]|uniref:Transmembrane protein n=1 Tax=Hanseniaspora osmophila TaxID=56408 RepID=A0A1E5R7V0_9ASCO|nr:Transmembrane protein [Hanseniaspora osmophila]
MGKCFLVIRFSSDFENDIKLDITKLPIHNITPAWLRRMCRDLRSSKHGNTHASTEDSEEAEFANRSVDLNKCRLKFIRNGRLLTGMHWNEFEMELRSAKESIAHTAEGQENDKYIYVQCLIGIPEEDDIDVQQELEEDRRSYTASAPSGEGQNGLGNETPQPVIGFDRLRSLGFSDEEIAMLRQQFQARMNVRNFAAGGGPGNRPNGAVNTNATNNGPEDDEYDEDQIFEDVTGEEQLGAHANTGEARLGQQTRPVDPREMEERWMETNALEDVSTDIANNITMWKYNSELLLGVSIGFLLGVFGLLLLIFFDKKTFNTRIQRAIFAGLTANFFFGIIRGW